MKSDKKHKIIISLATYKKRFQKLQIVLPYIINQTIEYDNIIINVQDDLTDEEFSNFKEFEKLNNKIIVKKREAKWRSFNKYLHTYFEYPDAVIIVCDDDIKYENNYFEVLYKEWMNNKDCIICHEINPIIINDFGYILIQNNIDVKLKQKEFGKYLSNCCLFPPNCFKNSKISINDYNKFMELTNGVHDELWLWLLSTLQGTQCICLDYTVSFGLDGISLQNDIDSLCNINSDSNNIKKYEEKINMIYGNDLKKIFNKIPCIFNVTRTNFMGIIGNIQWINNIFKNYNIIFDCNDNEIKKSHLILLAKNIKSHKWGNKIILQYFKKIIYVYK